MSQPIDDGGPAFPTPVEFDPNGQLISHGSCGMKLRDWLAGQALAGLMNRYDEHPNNLAQCAELACNAADAVIAGLKGGAE
jgi:hypothetical protein